MGKFAVIDTETNWADLVLSIGTVVADTHNWNIALAFDGVHFTDTGHHAFAENLRKELCP